MSDNKSPQKTVKDNGQPDLETKILNILATLPKKDGRADFSEYSSKAKKSKIVENDGSCIQTKNKGDNLLDGNSNDPTLWSLAVKNAKITEKSRVQQKNDEKPLSVVLNPFATGGSTFLCDTVLDWKIRLELLARYELMDESQKLRAISRGTLPLKWTKSGFKDELVEHGIENRNNKCFLISVIQLLSHAPPFACMMTTHDSVEKCVPGYCLACEWRDLQFQNSTRVGSLDSFIAVLQATWPEVSTDRNQKVEDCIKMIFGHFLFKSYEPFGFRPFLQNFVHIIGVEEKCMSCQAVYDCPDEAGMMLDLKSPNKFDHLQAAIDALFKPSKEVGTQCEDCGKKNVIRTKYFTATPNILLISDKERTLYCNGDTTHICKTINLGKHTAYPDINFGMYELCGYVNHTWVDLGEGHYTTSTKKYGNNSEWVTMDDAKVSPCVPEQYFSPYLMMYRRVSHCKDDEFPDKHTP